MDFPSPQLERAPVDAALSTENPFIVRGPIGWALP